MARRGWSTSNFLRQASGVVTAVPITIAAWAKTSVTASVQVVAGVFPSASSGSLNNFNIGVNSNATVYASTGDGTSNSFASSSTTISANTWFHVCGVFTSITSRAAFLNGGGKGTNAVSRTPSGINRTSAGVGDASTASSPFAPSGTGDICEVAIWNVALSDADVVALSTGVAAYMVRPDKLIGYWPIHGKNSPENNLKSNSATMAIQGALSASDHTRLFRSPGKVNFKHSANVHAYLQTVSAACAAAVSFTKGAGKGVAAACAGAVSYIKNPAKSLAVSCAGTIARFLAVARTVGAACAGTVSVSSPRNVVQSVAAACAGTVTLARAAGKGVVAACSGTVSAGKAVGKGMALACTGGVGVAKAVAKFLALAATCTASIQADFNLPPPEGGDDLGWIRIVLRRRR